MFESFMKVQKQQREVGGASDVSLQTPCGMKFFSLIVITCIASTTSFNAVQSSVKVEQGTRGRKTRIWPQHLVVKTENEWRSALSPETYHVLREEGTEPPWSSPLNDVKASDEGIFVCAGCRAPLFDASSKYDSGTGWPSFTYPIDAEAVALASDFKLLLPRIECRCASCDGHLGHVFEDGPQPTGLRFCMNGVAMEFCSEQSLRAMDEDGEGGITALNAEVERRRIAASKDPIRLPKEPVLVGATLNGVLAAVFLSAFLGESRKLGDTSWGLLGKAFDFFPLVFALGYGFLSIKGFIGTLATKD